MILLMVQNSDKNTWDGGKTHVNNGINYQAQLVQDFWIINSITPNWWLTCCDSVDDPENSWVWNPAQTGLLIVQKSVQPVEFGSLFPLIYKLFISIPGYPRCFIARFLKHQAINHPQLGLRSWPPSGSTCCSSGHQIIPWMVLWWTTMKPWRL